MKTEKEIRLKLRRIRIGKSIAKKKDREMSYIVNCKIEKVLKWVLDEEEVIIKDKRRKKK